VPVRRCTTVHVYDAVVIRVGLGRRRGMGDMLQGKTLPPARFADTLSPAMCRAHRG
jgi:hypothetical protein